MQNLKMNLKNKDIENVIEKIISIYFYTYNYAERKSKKLFYQRYNIFHNLEVKLHY